MIKTFLADPNCIEITVEDPSEQFDDLRDFCDYPRLLNNGVLGRVELNTDIDPKLSQRRPGIRVPTSKLLQTKKLEALRIEHKIAPRQFARLVEMHLYSKIAPHVRQAVNPDARLTQKGRSSNPDDKAFFYWRLLVKQRIYKKNKDVLMQLDRQERGEKVNEAVGEQAGDYERLLRKMEERKEKGGSEWKRERGKRKTIVDDDDDDDEDIEMGGNQKRMRSEPL